MQNFQPCWNPERKRKNPQMSRSRKKGKKRTSFFEQFLHIVGVKAKREVVFWQFFFKVDLHSHMGISRRDILNWLAEARS